MVKKGVGERLCGKRVIAFYLDGIVFTGIPLFILMICQRTSLVHLDVDSFIMAQLQFCVYLIYFVVSEFFFKTTLGKKIVGYKVFVPKRSKNMFFNFLLRTLLRLIPLDKFLFVLNGYNPLWHEKWSGVYTIKKE